MRLRAAASVSTVSPDLLTRHHAVVSRSRRRKAASVTGSQFSRKRTRDGSGAMAHSAVPPSVEPPVPTTTRRLATCRRARAWSWQAASAATSEAMAVKGCCATSFASRG
ncbi:MAG: hypothetical protein WDN72_10780 [Alphaproteobacteria bacterium]